MPESVAIVTLNILTIIIFSLRKRSMYLVINLAVADMLVGGFTEVMDVVRAGMCNVWSQFSLHYPEVWGYTLFPLASLTWLRFP